MSSITSLSREQEELVVRFDSYAQNVSAKTAKNLPLSAAFGMVDAIQEGKIGLIEAAKRFDFEKHDPSIASFDAHFKSFAYQRIRGAVVDAARKATFVRRRGIEQGIEVTMVTIDRPYMGDDDGSNTHSQIQLAAIDSDLDLVIDFEAALSTLTEKERDIVMSMGAGITGKELAEEYGVTESRISQIATAAKNKLRDQMECD